MQTLMLQADDEGIRRAAEIIQQGGLVGIPTETVYGLAGNALNGSVSRKIFAAKGRPSDNPLIVHIAAEEEARPLVKEFPEPARKLAAAYWPGPLTMVLPKSELVPMETSGGLSTVAVRLPAHPVANRLIRACGCPLAAPSGNLSGRPSPTTARHMLHDMDGRIDAILDGGPCGVGVESTVLALAEQKPRLLRPGGVTLEMLQRVVGAVTVDPAVLHKLADGAQAASPGMKYKHYAPKAKVILVKGDAERYREFVNSKKAPGVGALCFDEDRHLLKVPSVPYGSGNDSAAQARELFDALRELDERQEIQLVYARCPEPEGVGMAVYNRLIRAAGFEVITL